MLETSVGLDAWQPVVNVELDTSATDLPPTMYGGWVLRGDQADRLSNVVGEDAPERCAPGRAVMLVEVRTPGGAASVWVNADDAAIHERLHEHGRELLASLGVNAHRAPYLVADVRDLDQHGRPPERNAVCRCGVATTTLRGTTISVSRRDLLRAQPRIRSCVTARPLRCPMMLFAGRLLYRRDADAEGSAPSDC